MDLASIFKFLPPQMMQQMEGFLNFIRQQAMVVVNKQAEVDTKLADIQMQLSEHREILHRMDEYISGGIPAAPTDYSIAPIASLPPMLNEDVKDERHVRAGSFNGAPGPSTGGTDYLYGTKL